MSLRGGYQIIDLKMKEFSSSLNNYYRFPELFEDVKNGNAKMIILSGLNLDGVKYRDYEILVYEVNEIDTPMYYQAILRRMWNTRDYKVITKYLNIYPDDRVNITMEETIYEILPDGSLSLTSKNAVQNDVLSNKINTIINNVNKVSKGVTERYNLSNITFTFPESGKSNIVMNGGYANFNGRRLKLSWSGMVDADWDLNDIHMISFTDQNQVINSSGITIDGESYEFGNAYLDYNIDNDSHFVLCPFVKNIIDFDGKATLNSEETWVAAQIINDVISDGFSQATPSSFLIFNIYVDLINTSTISDVGLVD